MEVPLTSSHIEVLLLDVMRHACFVSGYGI